MNSEEIKLTEYLHNIIENNMSLRKENDRLWKQKLEYIDRIGKAIEYNNQIIKDTKSFYRPTEDTIYSGDCLIELAGRNIEILKGEKE